MNTKINHLAKRKGNVAVLLCFMLPALLGLVAFAVDYGFLLYVRTDLQRVADQAALAAVRELEPAYDGTQDLAAVREKLREYATMNAGYEFTILDSDIEIGRFDPAKVYTDFTLLNDGIFDSVRVKVRRTDLANSSVSLYFARVFGANEEDLTATATAVLQKATYLDPGADILPITLSTAVWNSRHATEVWSIYGDGHLEDQYGDTIPGNWGTIDIGSQSNSASDLVDQINNGLRQEDLNALHSAGTIPSNEHIDSQMAITLNGDTGLSSGMKSAIRDATGKKKLVPIYQSMTGQGGGLEFMVVGWGVVEIVSSHWQGNNNTYVDIRKSYLYDGDLRPHPDLGNTTNVIHKAFTSPVLVQ